MSQINTKQIAHSRSLEHSDHLSRLAQWLKQLPVQERYLQVRLNSPVIVAWLRKTFSASREEEPQAKIEPDLCFKGLRHSLKNLFDNLVLTSEQAFMDTVGFEFSLVDDVDRFLELLSSLASRFKSIADFSELPTTEKELPDSCSRERLAFCLAQFILVTIRYRCQEHQGSQIDLQKERLRKRQCGAFWTALSHEQKLSFLLLGTKNALQLKEQFNLEAHTKDLEKQIRQFLKLQKNQFCNRLLKCKLRRSNDSVRVYHRHLFESIQERLGTKDKKIRRRMRRATKSFSSNDTNETEGETVDRLTDKVSELANFKIQTDLNDFSQILSEKANTYFKYREIAFNRVQHVLQPYGVTLCLFGSCANGIALERSDVDMAVSGNILNYFPYGTIKEKTACALENINSLLASKKWVVSTKPITTAAIPVLKLQIHTGQPMEQPLQPDYPYQLQPGELDLQDVIIQVDLTVDTRGLVEPQNCHLGIRSTQLIGEWLAEIDGLYAVLIILKHLFLKKHLSVTYKGGISAYCLLVMIKAYIAHAELKQDVLPSVLLEGFLKFYGSEFDERTQGIDITNGKSPFYDRELNESKLEVKDPLNGRVMTKNAYLYFKIKEEFLDLRAKCMDDMKLQIRHHLTDLSEDKTQEVLTLSPEHYFSTYSSHYPKNSFLEHDSCPP